MDSIKAAVWRYAAKAGNVQIPHPFASAASPATSKTLAQRCHFKVARQQLFATIQMVSNKMQKIQAIDERLCKAA